MGEPFHDHVENLRKESRVLLASIRRNSKKIKKEIEKLRQQDAVSSRKWNDFERNTLQDVRVRRNHNFWNRRNDSSGVNAAFSSDYLYGCPTSAPASVPNMASKRILITSMKYSEDLNCNKTLYRKPVKGCYCASEFNRVKLRSPKAQHKSSYQCDLCRSRFYIIQDKVRQCIEKKLPSPSISDETLRRVQKIDYTPRSQFLRQVQSKVSILQSMTCDKSCQKSACPSVTNIEPETEDISEDQTKTAHNRHSRSADPSSNSSIEVPTNPEVPEDTHTKKRPIQKSSEGIQVVPCKLKSRLAKKTVSSKKSGTQIRQEEPASTCSKTKHAQKLNNEDCFCECTCLTAGRLSKKVSCSDLKQNRSASNRPRGVQCRETEAYEDRSDSENRSEDEDVKDLRKFRDQNYFDTHGSSHTLLSSRSSGSLQQVYLNDRLFPVPARKIHRRDLVVTMPPCATVQRKRVHYFPKFIVPQEKNSFNTNYKRRSRNCPLTGHAIDLGVLKASSPLNSLALRHQKRLL